MALLDADKMERDELLGEDTYDLFQTIEASFGVYLSDYHAYLGMTVREIAEEVCKKANYPDEEACLSAVSFYQLRRAFMTLFDIPRTAIRPDTPLSTLLPWKSRKARWRLLQETLGLHLPELTLDRWVFHLALLAPMSLLMSLRVFWRFPLNTFTMFMAWIVLIVPALWAVSPLARTFRPGTDTFGSLAKVVLAGNYAVFAQQYGGGSETDVLSALQQLIATEMFKSVDDIPSYTLIPQGLNIY